MAKKYGVEGGSQTALRLANRQRVIDELAKRGSITQAEIARGTGLAASTVSNIVSQLIKDGRVERNEQHGGPHGQLISLVPEPGLAVGIDLGHRHLTLVLSDLAHNLVAEQRIELVGERDATADLNAVTSLLDSMLTTLGARRDDVLGAAIAMPAPFDKQRHHIASEQILPGWYGIDVVKTVESALNCPVIADNDANMGAVGEYAWGHVSGVDDLVYVKLADGIGAGLILDGRVYRGADGSAGEIGHVTIDNGGKMCRCGNRGCLETVASVPAMVGLLRPILGEHITIHDVISKAKAGHTGCIRVLEDAGRVVGIALANLANTVNPRLIILGGVVADAGSIIINPIQQVLSRNAIHGVVDNLQFQSSTLGLRSHALGAVSLALQAIHSY